MRSAVRHVPSLLVLVILTAAGCAKAHPARTTPATPATETAGAHGAAAPAAAIAAAADDRADDVAADTRTGGSRTVLTSRDDWAGRAAPASPAVAQLRAEAAAALADPSVNALWGVEIQSLDTGELLYAQNAHALMMPASNMKIVTMSVAAARLGWDYRFPTTLEAAGPIANGTLTGDLVITGNGDPTISDRGGSPTRVFESWADQLRAAGITRITGRIIGDDNRFDDRPLGEGWAWDDMTFGYSAPGGALQFNENIVRVIITPAAEAGQPAVIRLEPEGSGLVLRTAVTTGTPASETNVNVSRERNSTTLYVSGIVPVGGKELTQSAAVDNPTIFFVNALRATLIRKGIDVTGPAVDIDDIADAGAPAGKAREATTARRVLLTHQSPPLADIGTTFMKVSQNLFGETLMTVIGERAVDAAAAAGIGTATGAGAATGPASAPAAATSTAAVSTTSASTAAATTAATASANDGAWPVQHHHVEAARKVYEQMLGSWGIPRSEFVLVDGSGLSRYNFVTPHMLVRILRRMARDAALGPTFEATLPIGGKDGTLGPRMKGTKSENNVRAKTGSLANVRALSGYVRTADGERLVFSILANNFNAPTAAVDAITDQLLERLANFTRKP